MTAPQATAPAELSADEKRALAVAATMAGGRRCGMSIAGIELSEAQERSVRSRILTNVDRSAGPEGCWPWLRTRTPAGYGKFAIHLNGKRFYRGAHVIAYITSNGPIPDGMLLRHTCDKPSCCNPDHLVPGTHLQNMTDMKVRGRSLVGSRNPQSKLNSSDIENIRSLYNDGKSQSAIADTYKVAQSLVSRILSGGVWASNQEDLPPVPARRSKLSGEQVADIRQALEAGECQSEIAMRHGVAQTTVSKIRRGETWGARDELPGAARVIARLGAHQRAAHAAYEQAQRAAHAATVVDQARVSLTVAETAVAVAKGRVAT